MRRRAARPPRFSPAELRAIVGTLHEGRTSREVGAAEGKTKWAVRKRLQRARARARARARLAGVEVPHARGCCRKADRVTLDQLNRRAV